MEHHRGFTFSGRAYDAGKARNGVLQVVLRSNGDGAVGGGGNEDEVSAGIEQDVDVLAA